MTKLFNLLLNLFGTDAYTKGNKTEKNMESNSPGSYVCHMEEMELKMFKWKSIDSFVNETVCVIFCILLLNMIPNMIDDWIAFIKMKLFYIGILLPIFYSLSLFVNKIPSLIKNAFSSLSYPVPCLSLRHSISNSCF